MEEAEEAGSNTCPRRHSNKGSGSRRQKRCSGSQPKLLRQSTYQEEVRV